MDQFPSGCRLETYFILRHEADNTRTSSALQFSDPAGAKKKTARQVSQAFIFVFQSKKVPPGMHYASAVLQDMSADAGQDVNRKQSYAM
jgi:hypothetical protein